MTNLQKAMELFGTHVGTATAKKAEVVVKGGRTHVDFGADFDTLAALTVIKDVCESVAKTLAAEIKDKARGIFAEQAFKTKTKPETFIGTGVHADGQIQLRKRSTNSPLDAETLVVLAKLKITVESGGVKHVEDIPERIVLNPDIVEDQKILKLVSEAIKNEPKLNGVPVFLKQEAETVYVTTDDTIAACARVAPTPKILEDLLKLVAVPSVGQYHIDASDDPKLIVPRALALLQQAKLLPEAEPVKAEPAKTVTKKRKKA